MRACEQLSGSLGGCQPGLNGGVYVATDSSSTAPSVATATQACGWLPSAWPASNVTMSKVNVNTVPEERDHLRGRRERSCTISGSNVNGNGATGVIGPERHRSLRRGRLDHQTSGHRRTATPRRRYAVRETRTRRRPGILAINAGNARRSTARHGEAERRRTSTRCGSPAASGTCRRVPGRPGTITEQHRSNQRHQQHGPAAGPRRSPSETASVTESSSTAPTSRAEPRP